MTKDVFLHYTTLHYTILCATTTTAAATAASIRFLCPNHKQIDALTLPEVQAAITEQLVPSNIEVSLAGDLSVEAFERLVLQYMGTVPPTAPKKLRAPLKDREAITVQTLGRSQQLGIYLPDSDERAMGYLAGPAPNRWGFYPGGETVGSLLQKASNKKEGRRDHPLFGYVALLILQEVTDVTWRWLSPMCCAVLQ